MCPTSVQLHVVEELLDLFGIDNVSDTTETPPLPEAVIAISRQALSGGVAPKAFQLRAWIQGREVLMLVDSGSSTSFINSSFARQLSGVRSLSRVCKVRVADGGELACTAEIPDCVWCTQGREFTIDMKLLPLGTYDAILGMDWLQANSPMRVDWCAKVIEITTPEGRARLRGHESQSSSCQ